MEDDVALLAFMCSRRRDTCKNLRLANTSYLPFLSTAMGYLCYIQGIESQSVRNSSTHKNWQANLSQAPPHAFQ